MMVIPSLYVIASILDFLSHDTFRIVLGALLSLLSTLFIAVQVFYVKKKLNLVYGMADIYKPYAIAAAILILSTTNHIYLLLLSKKAWVAILLMMDITFYVLNICEFTIAGDYRTAFPTI